MLDKTVHATQTASVKKSVDALTTEVIAGK
jgi:hypothetical protein